jgi:2-phospho-L-lactate guanylyltransferase (CobY/MobA/RfbA family)
MGLWAIIPIKSYATGQVNGIGSSFEDMLLVLQAVKQVTTIVVMTPDPKAVSVARSFGARTISVADLPAWETGLSRALQLAAAAGTARAMVFNPTAPLFDVQFLDTLLSTPQPSFSLTLVSSEENDDTAIALVSPPDYLHVSFGRGSFQSNIEQARSIAAPLTIYSTAKYMAKTG